MKRITDIILTAFLTTVFILLYLLLFSEVRYRHRANMIENYNHYVSILRFRNGKQRLQNESGKQYGPKADYFYPANELDTLVVYKLDRKCGYINVLTEQVEFDSKKHDFVHAWKFDESGLAAVLIGGKIGFIKKNGDFKITPQYPYKKKRNDDYDPEVKFNNGFCKIPSEDGRKFGLINQNNELVLPIIYDSIEENHGFRIVIKDGKYGLLNSKFTFLLDPIYGEISINQLGIVVLDTLNSQQLLGFDLKTISKHVFDDISSMSFEDLNLDEESNYEWKQYHDFSTFIINDKVGIINSEGKVVIDANCWDNIEYFGGDIFKAQLDEKYFLISAKGQFIH